jgi:hypothetical protein
MKKEKKKRQPGRQLTFGFPSQTKPPETSFQPKSPGTASLYSPRRPKKEFQPAHQTSLFLAPNQAAPPSSTTSV